MKPEPWESERDVAGGCPAEAEGIQHGKIQKYHSCAFASLF